MKTLFRILLFICVLAWAAYSAHAQLTNIYGVGASYNHSGSPSAAGTGLYAHLVSPALGTYAFTVVDVLPVQKSLTVNTSLGAGIAQKLFTAKAVSVFTPTSIGVSIAGSNTQWAWTTGAVAAVHVKGNWYILPSIRLVKANAGYRPIIGVLMAWGH